MNISKKNNIIYLMKAFAILSVIAAHVNIIDNQYQINTLITNIWNRIGLIGVICFYVISGYLFSVKTTKKEFYKKKFFKIIVPWIFATIISFAFHCIKIGSFNLFDYFKWCFGYGTIYYYLTNYVIFLIIFSFLYKNKKFLIFCVLLTIIQSILNTFIDFASFGYFGIYLNIFNWIGLFSLGLLIKKYDLNKYLDRHNVIFMISIIVFIFLLFIMIQFKIFGYFHILSLAFELCGLICIYYISKMFNKSRLLIFTGKVSFTIYLFHIQIIQKICWSLPKNLVTIIINPLIGWLFMVMIIYFGIRITKKYSFSKFLYMLIGIDYKEVL